MTEENNEIKGVTCPHCGHVNIRDYKAKRIICDGCEKEFSTKIKTFTGQSIELPEGIRRNKIGWILRNSCTDINYRTTVPELSVQELEFCLEHEKRVTGKKQLRSELRRRKRK